MTTAQAHHAARMIAGRDAIAGISRTPVDFLAELRTFARSMGWPIVRSLTNSRAYSAYTKHLADFKPRNAGDIIVACPDCTLPVTLVEGDAGYEGNGEAANDDGWAHNDCINARCPDCGEARNTACAHRSLEAA
jgi:hypothetical protein